MKHLAAIAIATLLVGGLGCTDQKRERAVSVSPCDRTTLAAARPSPYLLFDRVPAEPGPAGTRPLTAEDFTERSPWPSTPGYYSGGEVVYYREWNYDRQGQGFEPFNYNNRTFQSYRYGARYRD